ncbi:hypothetical protein [Arthrobacter sp. M4]|uniref:hypothetical protein n=1 Tax=Arthrobacter sp. M4 TaxID=218160 RepID=UPI001CDCA7ED|nr:hypothetical protein [Arthrobacter sp. M4]MCA4135392.1 hypothetical protein [Arthrobacter sp. M4]
MSTLTKHYTVDTHSVPGLSETVASLPLSLAPAGQEPAQLAAIAGTPGWLERTREALDGGALAAVVSSPSAADGILSLPTDFAQRAIVEWSFASNPGLQTAAEATSSLRETAVFADIELRVPTETNFDDVLLDVLIAAGRVFGSMSPVRSLHRDKAGWHLASWLRGQASDVPVSFSIIATDAAPATLRLRLLTQDGGLSASVPSPATAEPAEVRITGPDGERLLPTLWETSRRVSWRRAVAVAAGEAVSDDLSELDGAISLAPKGMG